MFIPSSAGSIIANWPTEDDRNTYPFGVYPSGMVVLRLGYLKNRPAFVDEANRRGLYDGLSRIVGPLHTNSLSGEPGFPAKLLNQPKIADAYEEFLSRVVRRAVQAQPSATTRG